MHLVELVNDQSDVLMPARQTRETTDAIRSMWTTISATLSSEFPAAGLTQAKVENRWKNLKQAAKKNATCDGHAAAGRGLLQTKSQ